MKACQANDLLEAIGIEPYDEECPEAGTIDAAFVEGSERASYEAANEDPSWCSFFSICPAHAEIIKGWTNDDDLQYLFFDSCPAGEWEEE